MEGILTNSALAIAKEVVGVGKVVSAVLAMKALSTYQPKQLVMVGYAGAVNPALSIGDCVLAGTVVQYDLDLRSFGLKRGETLRGMGRQTFATLPLHDPKLDGVKRVRMGTADRFLLRSWREENPWIAQEMEIDCADMESYAVAFACAALHIPCSVMRVISDDSQGRRPKDFGKFCRDANELISSKLVQLLASPSEKSPINL